MMLDVLKSVAIGAVVIAIAFAVAITVLLAVFWWATSGFPITGWGAVIALVVFVIAAYCIGKDSHE